MKNCPLCKWELEPVWNNLFLCWNIVCLDWSVYATTKEDAMRHWEEKYGEWMNDDKEGTNDVIIRFDKNE